MKHAHIRKIWQKYIYTYMHISIYIYIYNKLVSWLLCHHLWPPLHHHPYITIMASPPLHLPKSLDKIFSWIFFFHTKSWLHNVKLMFNLLANLSWSSTFDYHYHHNLAPLFTTISSHSWAHLGSLLSPKNSAHTHAYPW